MLNILSVFDHLNVLTRHNYHTVLGLWIKCRTSAKTMLNILSVFDHLNVLTRHNYHTDLGNLFGLFTLE